MTLLYPIFLWLLLPLGFFFFKSAKHILLKAHILILLLLVIALARPVVKESLQETNIEAKDIVIALDVSHSMRAEDISPTRYDFAKETIKALLEKNPSDNIMLIAFTSNPLLLSPPTTDHTLISVALDSLDPAFILTKGTSLKQLFIKLKNINRGHKSLILITDGGEENDAHDLIVLIQKANVTLTTLALGSTQGATIAGQDGQLLKDKEGNLVVSRINPMLATLTAAVNGEYVEASSTPSLTATALDEALRTQSSHRQMIQKIQHHYLELYQFPLLLAALLFLLVHTRAVKYLVIIFVFLGVQVEASFFDDYHLQQAYEAYETDDFNVSQTYIQRIKHTTLQSQMTLANTYYKMHDFKKAIKVYKSILSTSTHIKQTLYYNIANAYAQQGAYSKAKLYYSKTLQLGVDIDASYNLKIIATLKDKHDADLGIAHPKSQSGASSKSEMQDKEADQKEDPEEDQPSAGAGGENKAKEEKKKSKLLNDKTPRKQPLGSKVYELINKGYIHETQPW